MLAIRRLIRKMAVGFCLFSVASLFAQQQEPEITPIEKLEQKVENNSWIIQTLQKFKVSGYIQAQYQWAQPLADGRNFKLTNGINEYERSTTDANGDYKKPEDFHRFGIRRGRIKFSYEDKIATGVIQIDVTEKGISSDRNVVTFKDVYLSIKDPWFGSFGLKAGIFDRPFGHEIAYSSSRRESPERSRIIQKLFPDERDLGAMLTLQGPKNSAWSILKLEGGMFAGNGIKPQFTSHMDFIGHLSVVKKWGDNITLGGGVSCYLGGVFNKNDTVYSMREGRFFLQSTDKKFKYAKRQYIGVDLQFGIISVAGLTQLRGEWICGTHPGNAAGAYGFNFNGLAAIPTTPIFIRNIQGGYMILTQDFGVVPLTFIVKYDWYDPNIKVKGNDIASRDKIVTTSDKPTSNNSSIGSENGDIAMQTVGLGLMWRINAALKLTVYYDIVMNEKTDKILDVKNSDEKIIVYGYEKDRKDNVFTLRLQYKF